MSDEKLYLRVTLEARVTGRWDDTLEVPSDISREEKEAVARTLGEVLDPADYDVDPDSHMMEPVITVLQTSKHGLDRPYKVVRQSDGSLTIEKTTTGEFVEVEVKKK